MYLPGGASSVAHQFIRCVLHQLAPNGVFVQMFQTHVSGECLCKCVEVLLTPNLEIMCEFCILVIMCGFKVWPGKSCDLLLYKSRIPPNGLFSFVLISRFPLPLVTFLRLPLV